MSRAHCLKPNRTRRGLFAAAIVLAGGVALTACGNDNAAAKDATVIDVDLGRFVIEPAALTAPAGNLQLRVTNVDPDLVHNLLVNGKGTRQLAPGQSQTLNIPNVAAGDYRMLCDVPGHAAAGQTGTLIVTAAPEPAATSA